MKPAWLTRLLFISILFCVTSAIVIGLVYTYVEYRLPDVDILNDAHMQVPLRIYTRDGKLMAEYGSFRRTPVSLKQIPTELIHAVLATEDARYYSHPGVDIVGIARAAVAVVTTGRKVQGASTITMQVARNFFLSRKKTYWRKIREILLALKIDQQLSKDKVLELYLNKVYFGKGAYGVAAAADVYYGKPLAELTLAEMAMLAGLPQAPSRNNPIKNPDQARVRRNHVLDRMLEVGFIDQDQCEHAKSAPVTATFHGQVIQLHAPYFADMVRQLMVANFGKSVYDHGFSVYTTLSSSDQLAAQKALRQGLINYAKRHGYSGPIAHWGSPDQADLTAWQQQLKQYKAPAGLQAAVVTSVGNDIAHLFLQNGEIATLPESALTWARPRLDDDRLGPRPRTVSDVLQVGDVIWVQQTNHGWTLSELPRIQGALVSLNPQTGAVTALVGGFSFRLSNFNRVTQAERQSGSGFKPFVYSAALNKGYTLASVINDAPIVMEDTGENALWRPHNDNHRFYGPTRLKVGLAKSRNLVSIRLLQDIGIHYTLDYLKRFGFHPDQLPHSLSLALGSGTVTPLQLATGYTVFANGGYAVKPYFIQKIIGQNKQTIYALPNTEPQRTITAQNAYLMNVALQSVITSGTGRAARSLHRHDLAGKTGTTNQQVDAWFTGFNTNTLACVWVGFDDLKPTHAYASKLALPIWIDYMGRVLKDTPEAPLSQPDDIVTVKIDKKTGLLAPPGDSQAIFEQFRSSHVPTQYAMPSPQSTDTNATTPLDNTDEDNPIF